MGEYVNTGKEILFNSDKGALHIADCGSDEMAHFLAAMANAPKAEDGGPLIAFDYMGECDKTCSATFHTNYVNKENFVDLLQRIAEHAEQMNLYKKLFFRGKTPSQVGLEHPRLADSLAVEFDPNNTHESIVNVIHGLVGVITEAGEMAEVLLKMVEGNFDPVNAMEECGDVSWYVVRALRGMNTNIESMQRMNIDKLRGRHGETFNAFRDANRNLVAEREKLEAHHRDTRQIEMASKLAAMEFGECEGTNPAQPPKPGVDQSKPVWANGCWRFEKRPIGDCEGMDC